MSDLIFRCGPLDNSVKNLIKKYHYSKRSPSSVVLCGSFRRPSGLLGLDGPAQAACLLCSPSTEWALSVLELMRLVRSEDYKGPPLSSLISKTLKICKNKNLSNLIISYSDMTQNHHGGIYQSSNFKYHGKRKRSMDGLIVNGVFYPGRTCVSKFGTRSPTLLKSKSPHLSIDPHFDEGKHLYWFPLDKNGKKKAIELGLESNPYPKPWMDLSEYE